MLWTTQTVLWISGWSGVFGGFASGALIGLGFARDGFLGGYAGWRRRLVRLGHIACIALGMLQMLVALSPVGSASGTLARACAALWMIGAFAMPCVCFLSAWRVPFRHLFFVPVLSLTSAVVCTLVLIARSAH